MQRKGEGYQATAEARVVLARFLVGGVLAVKRAVLLHFEALAVVDLGLHRDVVPSLALGALEGDLHPLVVLCHDVLS